MTTRSSIVWGAVAACLVLAVGEVLAASPQAKQASEELEFGARAARRGYWQEALERFQLADELTPNQPRILNNIAVALEANGRFDEARTTYQAAMALAPGDDRLKANFRRFEEFYQTYVAPPEGDGDEATAASEAGDAGDGGGS